VYLYNIIFVNTIPFYLKNSYYAAVKRDLQKSTLNKEKSICFLGLQMIIDACNLAKNYS
jgi:hypothetical protein